ncbi:class I SAM-dependent methyltransferase [Anaerovibrio lipolyticus]|uniref:class I SAM-dependent methyltransferase n=1 Tax=Anaerovibrio lipolyticus TaxID=82374 RepID=UPI0004842C97|nr:class I SAM-dependent methyltransferase [Anaerovibrio lipolyticus]
MSSRTNYRIGDIPFVFAPLNEAHNPEGIPDSISMNLECRDGVVSQVKSETTERVLDKAYSLGSAISGQMDDFGNGKDYANDFLHWMDNAGVDLNGKRVLEIGCGTGYLMNEMERRGASCVGVEPGDSAEYGRKKYGVNIRREFFKPGNFSEKFDYIVFFGVLEHLYDRNAFLTGVKSLLKPNGGVLISVPNCEKNIEIGDISMLLSEHWSYFTQKTLEYTLLGNDLIGDVMVSDLGNVLNAYVKKSDDSASKRLLEQIPSESEALLKAFYEKYTLKKVKMVDWFSKELVSGNSIGIYVPGRFINWLNIISESVDSINLRFIDDNKILSNTYYPGFDNPIESLEDFMKRPTETVLVCSYTFEDNIRKKLIDAGYKGKVTSLRIVLE